MDDGSQTLATINVTGKDVKIKKNFKTPFGTNIKIGFEVDLINSDQTKIIEWTDDSDYEEIHKELKKAWGFGDTPQLEFPVKTNFNIKGI